MMVVSYGISDVAVFLLSMDSLLLSPHFPRPFIFSLFLK